jgi:hypothetical protein
MSDEPKYYWIECSEDGDVRVSSYTKDELERVLGDPETNDPDGRRTSGLALAVPGSDPMYWNGKSIIIKGEIVVPKPRDVVQKWELP